MRSVFRLMRRNKNKKKTTVSNRENYLNVNAQHGWLSFASNAIPPCTVNLELKEILWLMGLFEILFNDRLFYSSWITPHIIIWDFKCFLMRKNVSYSAWSARDSRMTKNFTLKIKKKKNQPPIWWLTMNSTDRK